VSPAGTAFATPLADPLVDDVAAELVTCLGGRHKRLPAQLLLDAPELLTGAFGTHYAPRIELDLVSQLLPDLAEAVGPSARVIEPGGEDVARTRLLLDGLANPAAYLPIALGPIAPEMGALEERYPDLTVRPLFGDVARPFSLPPLGRSWRGNLAVVSESVMGGLDPEEATDLLARLLRAAGPDAHLLVATDATRDRNALLRAYTDPNALFGRSVLEYLNDLHDADFDVDAFAQQAVWNEARSRVELHLVSQRAQVAELAGARIRFQAGEVLVAAHRHQHSPARFLQVLTRAGWRPAQRVSGWPQPVTLWLCERA
jgi:L-histidine Nalpha-methyltransferase